ncbi:hypothetical protein ACA910_009245 [Epithemia clementina (nom. ined.)]
MTSSTVGLSLAPGEMPGYTGWGRPEFTMAGYFEILTTTNMINDDTKTARTTVAGQPWEIFIQCRGHTLCSNHSWFYVRAYGPAVIAGRVEAVNDNDNLRIATGGPATTSTTMTYRVRLEPVDPGLYTVEVVVTFSNPPSIHSFPIRRNSNRPQQSTSQDESGYNLFYEGYMIQGFPLLLQVLPPPTAKPIVNGPNQLPICGVEDLTIADSNSGLSQQGRWIVTDMVRRGHYKSSHTDNDDMVNHVSLANYQQSWNSIGVVMNYQYRHCRLLPLPTQQLNPFRACSGSSGNSNRQQQQQQQQQPLLHLVMIGDSVMRLQYDLFMERFAQGMLSSVLQVDFYEIYGGYFLTQLVKGPKLRPILSQQQQEQKPLAKTRVIFFNTGLHDIHRLCGSEYATERQTYLNDEMQELSCPSLYRLAIVDLLDSIQQSVVPSSGSQQQQTIAIFQTTTAGWPKYGNYGVNWDPRYGQPLPLDSSFVHEFNRIALDVIQPLLVGRSTSGTLTTTSKNNSKGGKNLQFHAVDAFWISLARPDNREIDEKSNIGKKLSHPGLEVLQNMVRIWSMLLLQLVCT